jgi:hypothetical protein
MINVDKMSEGLDYNLIPTDDTDNDQAWDVRLEKHFPETVIRFGNIKFDGVRDCLTFDFMVKSSPDNELSSQNTELQEVMGAVLEDILERAYQEGWMITGDEIGNKTRTNDFEESADE